MINFQENKNDWQYDNFGFKITPDNKMIFELLVYNHNWKIEKVGFTFSTSYFDLNKKQYYNRKIRILSDSTNHHKNRDNKTLYRNKFYHVVKFGNLFFEKKE